MFELPVKRGRRQRDLILEAVDAGQRIGLGVFGVVIAHADAFATVDATLVNNMRPSAAHADGLRGTSLEAVGAALAFFLVQANGMEKLLVHGSFLRNRPRAISA